MTRQEFKEQFLTNAFYWITEDNYLRLQNIFQEFGIKCHTGEGSISWHTGFKNLLTFPPDLMHEFEYYQKTDFWHSNSRYGEPKDYELMLKAYSELS
ncbi:hypothetical protein M0Q97_11670 [Candidatus Dojkabacteria bacterium]|jgi:hypothetical protein|nr:hypothetical protein [Candidatus Dojkabacteria bacterium]